MRFDVLDNISEAVAIEKPDCKARCVRRYAEDIELSFRIQIKLPARKSFCKQFHACLQCGKPLFIRLIAVTVAKEQVRRKFLVLFVGVLRPADNGSIADPVDIFPVRQQMIQRGRICKGCIFSDRRILVLFLVIRTECRCIE